MRMKLQKTRSGCQCRRAFTLVEAAMASAIATLSFGGVIYGYVQSAKRAEWSAYSLAAQSYTTHRMEQARACKWDPNGSPAVDELVATNFPTTYLVLDMLDTVSTNGAPCAQVTTTITTVSSSPPLKMVTITAVWPYYANTSVSPVTYSTKNGPFKNQLYTNSISTYRAPDT